MSQPSPLLPDDETLGAALIAHHRLSEEAVSSIYMLMESEHVGFAEAAVRLALVTPGELEQTLTWLERKPSPRREGSIIETALRRRSTGTQIVVHTVNVKPSQELLIAHQPYHPRSERMRSLRTELLLLNDTHSRSTALAVLSPGNGEGRSLLAAELAISFAQLARPTLLVDGDLRNPRQHQLYNAQNDRGLGQALAFHDQPQLYGVEGLPHLSLLTAGAPTSNPLELLSDGNFSMQLRAWRNQFAFIVLDTPPVSKYADGLALAALVDEIIVVTRAKHTSHQQMKEMLRRVATTQARIVGAVLNKF